MPVRLYLCKKDGERERRETEWHSFLGFALRLRLNLSWMGLFRDLSGTGVIDLYSGSTKILMNACGMTNYDKLRFPALLDCRGLSAVVGLRPRVNGEGAWHGALRRTRHIAGEAVLCRLNSRRILS